MAYQVAIRQVNNAENDLAVPLRLISCYYQLLRTHNYYLNSVQLVDAEV